jgi:D-glycerate 3-kinase
MIELRQDREVVIPVFDKGLDDRVGTRRVHGPFDVVLLEGWCVGARAVSKGDLAEPANSLERERDFSGDWRRYVNSQLAGGYAEVTGLLDYSVFLRVPNLTAIRRWRLEQESIRPESQRYSSKEIDSFVQYFERITVAMLAESPPRADLVVELADDHSIARASFRSARAARCGRPR